MLKIEIYGNKEIVKKAIRIVNAVKDAGDFYNDEDIKYME